MLLENNYYVVRSRETEGDKGTFRLSLPSDCAVYRGHFPGHPVCPGACNIETIRECVMMVCGSAVTIDSIKRCRFTSLATPETCPEADVTIALVPVADGYDVEAVIGGEGVHYVEFKGHVTVVKSQ